MKKTFIVILFFAAALMIGCNAKNETRTNSTTVETKTNSTDDKEDTPKTEKTERGFVPSESGTEKAKPEAGKTNVQGKVLYNGKPVPNVEVRVCEKFNRFIGGCDGETFKSKTDENGEYLIANITPNVYEALLVQVFNTKDYIFATQRFGVLSAKYKFEADKTFFAPDTNLFKKDLKIQNPKPKSKADSASLEFKWDAYPDAAYYELSVSPNKNESDSTSISAQKVEGGATTFKPETPLKSGSYRVKVEAFNANDIKLADSDKEFEFTVTDGETDAGADSTAP